MFRTLWRRFISNPKLVFIFTVFGLAFMFFEMLWLDHESVESMLPYGMIGLLLGLVVGLARLKARILQGFSVELQFLPTNPELFPLLDADLLSRYTNDLESIGFVQLMDYTVNEQAGKLPLVFCRLFSHPTLHCAAQTLQVFVRSKAITALSCTVFSNLEQDWSLGTTNEKQYYFYLLPKALWTYHPDTTPVVMLPVHLKRRQQIIDVLELKILANSSPQAVFANLNKRNRERKQAMERQNLLSFAFSFARAVYFNIRPKHEWMGDYSKMVVSKKKRQN